MNQGEIERTLIQMLEVLQAGAEEERSEVGPATVPLTELGFFDSLLALETTIALEERFSVSFGEDTVFWDKENAKPLSVSQIAENIVKTSGTDE